MYAIARRLSLEARRETARVFAELKAHNPNAVRHNCYCPLGYALEAMGLQARDYSGTIYLAPPDYVIERLLDSQPGVADEAARFIAAWDDNRLQDIHTALGVRKPKEQAAPCSPESTPTSPPTPPGVPAPSTD